MTEQLFRARPMSPVGRQAACFLFHEVPGGLLLGWHCLPRRPAGGVACRANCTASLALLPPCHPAGLVVHVQVSDLLVGDDGYRLLQYVYCSIVCTVQLGTRLRGVDNKQCLVRTSLVGIFVMDNCSGWKS